MPSINCRRGQTGGRPTLAPFGNNGSSTAHCSSVRSPRPMSHDHSYLKIHFRYTAQVCPIPILRHGARQARSRNYQAEGGDRGGLHRSVPVAQWIEQAASKRLAAGLCPAEPSLRALVTHVAAWAVGNTGNWVRPNSSSARCTRQAGLVPASEDRSERSRPVCIHSPSSYEPHSLPEPGEPPTASMGTTCTPAAPVSLSIHLRVRPRL